MATQVDNYMRDRALFSSDVLTKALKWQTNYAHPLAVAYRDAKNRLDGCVTEARQRAGARQRAYEELKARMDFALGVLFGLMGPFTEQAITGLRTSMQVSTEAMETRVLTQWYSSTRSPNLSFETLLERNRIRQGVLNYVVERGITGVSGQVRSRLSPASGATGAPTDPTGSRGTQGRIGTPTNNFTLPEALLTGEFAPAEFEQNVQNIFNGFAVELNDTYMRLFNGPPEPKRQFLINATKTVLACPPPRPLDQVIPINILSNQLFGMVATNYVLSFRPSNGMIWPTIGYDLGFTINRALMSAGLSIITNNPRMGVRETFPPVVDEQMAWDGLVMPNGQAAKLRENATWASTVLEAYMQSIAMSDDIT
jgi:hypothetical protein